MVAESELNTSDPAPLIYSAPPVDISGETSEEFLVRHLESETAGTRFAALFQLGNNSFRRSEYAHAVNYYQQAVKIQEDSAELRTNLGAALIAVELFAESETHLRRALILNNTLEIPHYHLARVALNQRHPQEAQERFEKYLTLNARHIPTLLALARIAKDAGSEIVLREYLDRILEIDPEHQEAQVELVKLEFEQGRILLANGEIEKAVRTWARAYKTFPRPFSSHQGIANELRSIVQNFTQAAAFQEELNRFRDGFKANPDDKAPFYGLVLTYLFVIGLIPEGFEEREELANSAARWRESLELRGEHPYPHYRLALIALYGGEIETAYLELTICRDKLPPKKHIALRVRELFQLIDIVREIERKGDEFRNINLPDFEWEQAGFLDPFTLRAWRETGLAPTVAAKWLEAAISPTRATAWSDMGVTPDEATTWTKAGFDDPEEVRNWIRGGFSPEVATVWKSFAPDGQPLAFDTIIQYRRAGFDDPSIVYRWSQVFQIPFEATTWSELGFEPEEAGLWRGFGFTDPHDALQRKQQGLSPEDALKRFNDPRTDKPSEE